MGGGQVPGLPGRGRGDVLLPLPQVPQNTAPVSHARKPYMAPHDNRKVNRSRPAFLGLA